MHNMTYANRIQDSSYLAPDGTEISFILEDVERSIGVRASRYELIGTSSSYVQQLGVTGLTLPVNCIFYGDNNDLEADAFVALLALNGVGVLRHQRYGNIDVAPFGTITQKDKMKTAAGVSVVSLTFVQTLRDVYPSSITDVASNLNSAIAEWQEASANQLESNATTDLENSFFNDVNNAIEDANRAFTELLSGPEDLIDGLLDDYLAIEESLLNTVDILIGKPLDIAFQISILVALPAQSAALIQDQFDAYLDLSETIINDAETELDDINTSDRKSNSITNADQWASSCFAGLGEVALRNSFRSRQQSLEAAERLDYAFGSYINIRDKWFSRDDLSIIDQGESLDRLKNVVIRTIQYLIEVSFTLDDELTFITEKERTPIDVLGQLYQSIDDEQLNELIESNDILGQDIILLSKDTEVIYYE